MGQIVEGNPALTQAVLNGPDGKPLVVLAPGEAFLLSRRDDFAIAKQGRGSIVVVG
jgi:hypothetical protein